MGSTPATWGKASAWFMWGTGTKGRRYREVGVTFCHWDGDTLVLNVLGRPRAPRTAFGQVIGKQLEIHVAEMPVRGKATAHLVQFLAGEFQVAPSAIVVVFGVYNVNKQLRVTAPKRFPPGVPWPTQAQGALF